MLHDNPQRVWLPEAAQVSHHIGVITVSKELDLQPAAATGNMHTLALVCKATMP
jgi:hypothetical protein